ncbi:hypothetical protein A0H81_11032 [Grifola frondosa]|uniref:Uncharacterized protein n=1 Tax=Grifola frondosa TaxID=5627 RepID=A0A1C7M0Q6_GRIFR|nr:hypothetical protein A0H81_11032 [Grifola frondosa]
MTKDYKHLTPEQVEFFMENGYIVVKQAFTKEKAAEFMQNMWVRLGLDPNDKSTWDRERIHMPSHKREAVAMFAPKAWEIMKELLGGEERIDEPSGAWNDSFIVNLGTPALERVGSDIAPADLDNWHVDGDFFVHFLDSPEQALLVIPLFSDIAPRGGATFISPDGLDMIANYLAAHPEGVIAENRTLRPSTCTAMDPRDDPGFWSHLAEVKKCKRFVELTGETGDVVLMHPFMLHSASKNHLRIPRVITNPPVSLKEPFNYARDDPEAYSLIERKTLKAMGVDRFEFKPTTERRLIVPKRVAIQQKMLEDERKRLASLAEASGNVEIAAMAPPIAVA